MIPNKYKLKTFLYSRFPILHKSIDPNTLPHNKNDDFIVESQLNELKSDSVFNRILKTYKKCNNFYKLDDIVSALELSRIEYQTKTLTQHTYQILMPYLHALYGIQNNNLFLPCTFINNIPIRFEYLMLYWLNGWIENDPLLLPFKHLLTIKYQYEIPGEIHVKRIYDACFPNLKLLIEIQEKSTHHDNSDNDINKRCLAIKYSYGIYYIKEKEFNSNPKYLKHVQKQLRELLFGSIFYHSDENSNYPSTFLFTVIHHDLLIQKNKNDLIVKASSVLHYDVINTFNTWYLRYQSNNKILLSDVIDFICTHINKNLTISQPIYKHEQLHNIVEDDGDYLDLTLNNGALYIDYNFIEEVFSKYFEYSIISALLFIFRKTRKYNDQMKLFIANYKHLLLIDNLYTHFYTDLQTQHLHTILIEKNNILLTNKSKIDTLIVERNDLKSQLTHFIKLESYIESFIVALEARLTKLNKQSVINAGKLALHYIQLSKKESVKIISRDEVTIVNNINKSILLEYSDFGIIYTGSSKDSISFDDLKEHCALYGYADQIASDIIDRFAPIYINNLSLDDVDEQIIYGITWDIHGV